MKRVLLIAGVVVAAGLGVWFFLHARQNGQDAGRYKTVVVDRGDVAMTVTATGTISAVTTVQVGSQVSGIIAALYAAFNPPASPSRPPSRLSIIKNCPPWTKPMRLPIAISWFGVTRRAERFAITRAGRAASR